jgi:hypothetical protein
MRLKLFEDFAKPTFDYKKWKRENVTLRGIREVGQEVNGGSAILGDGLYTAPLSNKSLAKQYGEVKFVVNGRPKKPLKFQSMNPFEIYLQNLVIKLGYAKDGGFPDMKEFYKNTSIKEEIMKLGYDGVEIVGREMVNYDPKNVVYFSTERQLENWAEFAYENGEIK